MFAPGRFYDEMYQRLEVCCGQANVNSNGASLPRVPWDAHVARHDSLMPDDDDMLMRFPPCMVDMSKPTVFNLKSAAM